MKTAALIVGAGGVFLAAGVAWVYPPAGLIVIGLSLMLAGGFLVDVGRKQ